MVRREHEFDEVSCVLFSFFCETLVWIFCHAFGHEGWGVMQSCGFYDWEWIEIEIGQSWNFVMELSFLEHEVTKLNGLEINENKHKNILN
jgi:hypothetical protein